MVWSCKACTLINADANKKCEECFTQAPSPFEKEHPAWFCHACTLENGYTDVACAACHTLQKPVFGCSDAETVPLAFYEPGSPLPRPLPSPTNQNLPAPSVVDGENEEKLEAVFSVKVNRVRLYSNLTHRRIWLFLCCGLPFISSWKRAKRTRMLTKKPSQFVSHLMPLPHGARSKSTLRRMSSVACHRRQVPKPPRMRYWLLASPRPWSRKLPLRTLFICSSLNHITFQTLRIFLLSSPPLWPQSRFTLSFCPVLFSSSTVLHPQLLLRPKLLQVVISLPLESASSGARVPICTRKPFMFCQWSTMEETKVSLFSVLIILHVLLLTSSMILVWVMIVSVLLL